MRRKLRPRPSYLVNGWVVEKQRAERFLWHAIALTPDGYLVTWRGFHNKKTAVAFAEANQAPRQKEC